MKATFLQHRRIAKCIDAIPCFTHLDTTEIYRRFLVSAGGSLVQIGSTTCPSDRVRFRSILKLVGEEWNHEALVAHRS